MKTYPLAAPFLAVVLLIGGCSKSSDTSAGNAAPGETGVASGGDAVMPGGGGGGPTASEPAEVSDGTAALNAANTNIGFTGTKPDGTVHSGGFGELTGTIQLDGQSVKSVTVDVQTESLWSDADRLTTHLKSPDFFNVREHPNLTFTSTSVATGDDGVQTITGELTMLGKTNEISFPATVTVSDEGLNLKADFTIDRTLFGMNYGEGEIDKEVQLAVVVGAGAATNRSAGANADGGRGGRGGPGGGFDPVAMFARWDADGDGKLVGDEITERMRERVAEIDTDGDGAISSEEWQERARQFGGGRRGGGGRGPGGDGGGGGGGETDRPARPPVE